MCLLKRREVNKMKVKAKSLKMKDMGLMVGKEYEVLNKMPSAVGGYWLEIMSDINFVTLIRLGYPCAVGEWEEVK